MMTKTELNQRCGQVLEALKTLSAAEAMAVVAAAMQELSGCGLRDTPRSSSEELIARRSRLKVEKDPEIRDFVHSLSKEPIDRITQECKARFGSRAPSKSAIYTYIKRLERRRGLREV